MPSDGIIRNWKLFDPQVTRNEWLNWRLNTHRKYTLDEVPTSGMVGYLCLEIGHMEEAFIVGLSDEVRPILEYNIAWIEAQPEATLNAFPGPKEHWPSRWRQALGLFKWLSRGDPAKREFSAALNSRWMVQARDKSRKVSDLERRERDENLEARLALALAADQPLLGLQFIEAIGIEGAPDPEEVAMVKFGWWACRHLVDGGSRDAGFVSRGEEMLTASLVEGVMWYGTLIEPALWLKAIYFDSGVVKTPEQAIAKAYDSMSWLERPNFVTGGLNE
jgi:hypothetical protein